MKTKFLYILFISILFNACNDSGKDKLLPVVTGEAGEVVLVIEEDYWESRTGEIWKEICQEPVKGLPQIEPMFDLVRIPKSAFTRIFKSHRNIILMDIGAQNNTAQMIVQENLWARPQVILTISAPDKKSYNAFIDDNKQKITDILAGAERKRISANYEKYEEKKIRVYLDEKYGIKLTVPKGYTLDVDTTDFIWISHETPYISQGLFIYFHDYTDTLQFEKEYLINKRNEKLKAFVPGTLPKSYMTTETEYPVQYEQYYLKDNYVAELKGLWRVENDFMGGPFHSLSTVDEKRNRIVTIEGYLYSPKYDKRNYMRQLEAILFSLEFN